MFKIDQHIEYLLLNHNCVIVPGFGGFVVHNVPARFDESDGMMLPPCTTVGFNPQLVLNDSLLIQSFIEAYDMSYPEAQREVEKETHELRGLIADNGKFEIHSVGTLSLNADGNYEFAPCEAGILAPRFYGLAGIETQEENTFICANVGNVLTLPVIGESTADEPADTIEDEEDGDTISIRRSTLRRLAVACAALLLVAAVPFITTGGNPQKMLSAIDLSFFTNLMPKSEVSTVEIPSKKEVYNASEKNTVEKPATKQEAETAAKTETAPETKAEPVQEVKAEPATPAYTIVLAAQVSKVNAEYFVNNLTRKGMSDVRVIGEGKGRKVVMGTFKTEEEAQQGRRSIASSPEFASAWVMQLK